MDTQRNPKLELQICIIDIVTLEKVIYDSMEYSTREEDEIGHVNLYFMNAEDVLLNHPTLILKLGLVEVLKVMEESPEYCPRTF